jgi:hypothetical protein
VEGAEKLLGASEKACGARCAARTNCDVSPLALAPQRPSSWRQGHLTVKGTIKDGFGSLAAVARGRDQCGETAEGQSHSGKPGMIEREIRAVEIGSTQWAATSKGVTNSVTPI